MAYREATIAKKKVLVVDDEHDFLSIMNFFLTREGFDVETASDGHLAIQAAKRSRPDLILLDVIMPVMDGYRALEALRSDEGTRNIPVIMLSIMDEIDETNVPLDITDYLVKPFSTEDLIQKIRVTLTA
jgi:CheY-like chemotaxis protein